jgi:hypothetical protein
MKPIDHAAPPRTLALALALALAATACTGGAGSAGSSSPSESPSPSTGAEPSRTIPQVSPPTSSVEPGAVPEAVSARVVADAAAKAGVAPDAVTVVRAEPTTWTSGALGCPEPGHVYTQALVQGYWIVVEAGGKQYDYRVTQDGSMKLCENPPGPG